jgi:hypothetical protein
MYAAMAVIYPASAKAGDLEILSRDSPLYKEVAPHASTWKRAVVEKNTKLLISYAWPDYRKGVERELRSKRSNLNTSLYNSRKSVS